MQSSNKWWIWQWSACAGVIYNKGLICSYPHSFKLSLWFVELYVMQGSALRLYSVHQNCVLGRCAYMCSIIVLQKDGTQTKKRKWEIRKRTKGEEERWILLLVNAMITAHVALTQVQMNLKTETMLLQILKITNVLTTLLCWFTVML